jgi:hypothetical protein
VKYGASLQLRDRMGVHAMHINGYYPEPLFNISDPWAHYDEPWIDATGDVIINDVHYAVTGPVYLNHQYGLVPQKLETISWHWLYGQWQPCSSSGQCGAYASFQCVVPLIHSQPTSDSFCNVLLPTQLLTANAITTSATATNTTKRVNDQLISNTFISQPHFTLAGSAPWTSPVSGRVYNTIHTVTV